MIFVSHPMYTLPTHPVPVELLNKICIKKIMKGQERWTIGNVHAVCDEWAETLPKSCHIYSDSFVFET